MTIKKTMTNEDYKKASMYNITNYLYNCYQNKTEPSMELMANVNFSEISSKEVTYYSATIGPNTIKVSENLAQNCISILPYEAYAKFVTTDWMNFPDDYDGKLVSYAIHNKNISLVEKFHEIGLEKALLDKEFAGAYTNKFLVKVLRPSLVSKEEYHKIKEPNFGERYLDILRKATAEINYFHNRIYRLEPDSSIKYSNNIDWLSKATDISRSSSSGGSFKNEILVNLASQPELMPVLEDAFILLLKSNPKDIKSIFGLTPFDSEQDKGRGYNNIENILSVAFKNNNFAAAKMIVESFGLTEQNCLVAYDNNLRDEFARLEHNGYDFEEDKSCGLSLMTKDFFNKYYNDLKSEFFPNSDTEFLPLFLLTKDNDFKKSILNNEDTLFNLPIAEDFTRGSAFSNKSSVSIQDDDESDDDIDQPTDSINFTINDCLYMAKIIDTLNKFIEKEGKNLVFPKNRSHLSHMKLSDFVIDHIFRLDKDLLNSVDASSIPDKYWNKFEDSTFKKHLNEILCIKQRRKFIPIDFEEFNMLVKTTRLDTQLAEKTNFKQSKLKI